MLVTQINHTTVCLSSSFLLHQPKITVEKKRMKIDDCLQNLKRFAKVSFPNEFNVLLLLFPLFILFLLRFFAFIVICGTFCEMFEIKKIATR